jgi:hypothetical protein
MILKDIEKYKSIPLNTLKYLKKRYKIKNSIKERITSRKFNPTKEELENLIYKIPTSKISELYGVSDKAIEKRCKKLNIKKPPRGYWAKIKSKNTPCKG